MGSTERVTRARGVTGAVTDLTLVLERWKIFPLKVSNIEILMGVSFYIYGKPKYTQMKLKGPKAANSMHNTLMEPLRHPS